MTEQRPVPQWQRLAEPRDLVKGMMKMGRVALITGASRGIGAATAQVLAQQGFRVIVNYLSSAEKADEVVQIATAAGGEAVAIRADVTQADDVAAMVTETEQRWGGVDV